uniref:MHD1 domain-containing protein n=1 Tax=Timema poppense TaxID=170557 RepID=A0A7R9CFD6_TIMPO|nr:unnamed protein product [Timema poppensis]
MDDTSSWSQLGNTLDTISFGRTEESIPCLHGTKLRLREHRSVNIIEACCCGLVWGGHSEVRQLNGALMEADGNRRKQTKTGTIIIKLVWGITVPILAHALYLAAVVNGCATSEDLFWKLDALQSFIRDLHWPDAEFRQHLEQRLKLMACDMIESCIQRQAFDKFIINLPNLLLAHQVTGVLDESDAVGTILEDDDVQAIPHYEETADC